MHKPVSSMSLALPGPFTGVKLMPSGINYCVTVKLEWNSGHDSVRH